MCTFNPALETRTLFTREGRIVVKWLLGLNQAVLTGLGDGMKGFLHEITEHFVSGCNNEVAVKNLRGDYNARFHSISGISYLGRRGFYSHHYPVFLLTLL